MAMGEAPKSKQDTLFIMHDQMPELPRNEFYDLLNQVLAKHGFNEFVRGLAAPFYHEKLGRPSLAPERYVRLMLIGFLEGIDSERQLAWRLADSLSLRRFLYLGLTDPTPDHSTLSGTRRRLSIEFHEEVMRFVLEILVKEGLLKGERLAVDASTMKANASMKSLRNKVTGETYNEFLRRLAEESGLETPTQEELAAFDRKRKGKKTSNDDWENPHDPDARITKMKDGSTKQAYKPENIVDTDTSAIVAADVHHADQGDTTTVHDTLSAASTSILELTEKLPGLEPRFTQVVADKGYYGTDVIFELAEAGYETYISEPKWANNRNWGNHRGTKAEVEALRQAVEQNGLNVRSEEGRALLRKRGETVERSFAHILDTGGMRRTTLRGRLNVKKRYLLQCVAYNLGLVMRKLYGFGKPRAYSACFALILYAIWRVFVHFGYRGYPRRDSVSCAFFRVPKQQSIPWRSSYLSGFGNTLFSTAC